MEQGNMLATILAQSCEQVSGLLGQSPWVQGPRGLLGGDPPSRRGGPRLARGARSLFSNGIDPMVVIRWKDIFGLLERAIDLDRDGGHTIEAIAVKRS